MLIFKKMNSIRSLIYHSLEAIIDEIIGMIERLRIYLEFFEILKIFEFLNFLFLGFFLIYR